MQEEVVVKHHTEESPFVSVSSFTTSKEQTILNIRDFTEVKNEHRRCTKQQIIMIILCSNNKRTTFKKMISC